MFQMFEPDASSCISYNHVKQQVDKLGLLLDEEMVRQPGEGCAVRGGMCSGKKPVL